jgi:hypothetical protein
MKLKLLRLKRNTTFSNKYENYFTYSYHSFNNFSVNYFKLFLFKILAMSITMKQI